MTSVYELATELGVSAALVVDVLGELGETADPEASLNADTEKRLRRMLFLVRHEHETSTGSTRDDTTTVEPRDARFRVDAALLFRDSGQHPHDTLVGAFGTYKLGEMLTRDRRGSYGTVWTAVREDKHGHRDLVAVKFLHHGAEHRDAVAEYQRSLDRGHHIVRGIDHSTRDSGTPFVVMEYVRGRTLESRVYAEPGAPPSPVSRDELKLLLACLGDAIEHLYRKAGPRNDRSYHGDLSPRNVMYVEDMFGGQLGDHYKVVDLGHGHHDGSHTAPTIKWARYRSPEMYSANGTPIHRIYTDVHLAAQVVLFALTGQHPTGENTDPATDFERLAELIPDDVSEELRLLLTDMLVPDPYERSRRRDVHAVVAGLRSVPTERSATPAPDTKPTPEHTTTTAPQALMPSAPSNSDADRSLARPGRARVTVLTLAFESDKTVDEVVGHLWSDGVSGAQDGSSVVPDDAVGRFRLVHAPRFAERRAASGGEELTLEQAADDLGISVGAVREALRTAGFAGPLVGPGARHVLIRRLLWPTEARAPANAKQSSRPVRPAPTTPSPVAPATRTSQRWEKPITSSPEQHRRITPATLAFESALPRSRVTELLQGLGGPEGAEISTDIAHRFRSSHAPDHAERVARNKTEDMTLADVAAELGRTTEQVRHVLAAQGFKLTAAAATVGPWAREHLIRFDGWDRVQPPTPSSSAPNPAASPTPSPNASSAKTPGGAMQRRTLFDRWVDFGEAGAGPTFGFLIIALAAFLNLGGVGRLNDIPVVGLVLPNSWWGLVIVAVLLAPALLWGFMVLATERLPLLISLVLSVLAAASLAWVGDLGAATDLVKHWAPGRLTQNTGSAVITVLAWLIIVATGAYSVYATHDNVRYAKTSRSALWFSLLVAVEVVMFVLGAVLL